MCVRDLSSPIVSNISSFLLCQLDKIFCPADFLHFSLSPHFKSPKSFYNYPLSSWSIFLNHTTPHSTSVSLSSVSSMFCLLFLSEVLSSLRMLLFLSLFFF